MFKPQKINRTKRSTSKGYRRTYKHKGITHKTILINSSNYNNNTGLYISSHFCTSTPTIDFIFPTQIQPIISQNFPTQESQYAYVLDYLTNSRLRNLKLYDQDGIAINAQHLNKMIGRQSTSVIQNLIQYKIIEKSATYKVGKTANRYKFCSEIDTEKLSILTYPTKRHNDWLLKVIAERLSFEKSPKKQSVSDQITKYQYDILCNKILLSPEGKQFLKTQYPHYTSAFNNYPNLSSQTVFDNIIPEHIPLFSFLKLQYRCYRDGKSRLYSNLTNLHTPYREYLLMNRKKMWQVDIVSSQLVFGLPVIKNEICKTQNQKPLPSDYLEFKKLVLSGKIYEWFAEQHGLIKTGQSLSGNKRKKMKQYFFRSIWYANIYCSTFNKRTKKLIVTNQIKTDNRGIAKIMKHHFPSVYKAIWAIKKRDGHQAFPIAMQHTEAGFILDTLGKQLMQQGVDFLTIHDSVLVDCKHKAENVETLMQQSFQRQFGFIPKFTIS